MPQQKSPWVVSSGGDAIKLWDLDKNFWNTGTDGCHTATVSYTPMPGSTVTCARWNHTMNARIDADGCDGKHISDYVVASAGNDPRITMWTTQGQRLGIVPEGEVEKSEENINTLCFSRRSRIMVTAGSGRVVYVYDMKRRVCTQTLSGHPAPVTAVAMNAKDEQLASVGETGMLCLHNLNSGTRVAQLKDPDGQALQAVEYSPHTKHLLATAGDGGAVHLWNATARKIERSWKRAHAAPVMGLSFSPTDPKVLVTVGLDKRLVIIDPTSSAPPVRVSAEAPLSCVHFKDDGVTVAVGTADGRVLFYDTRARVWKTQLTLQAFKKSVQVTCVQWQSFLHAEESEGEPPARTLEVNFQPEIDLRSVPPNLRGTDKVMASLGSALFTPRGNGREADGVNGGPHTPVRGAEGVPSEMDVFSPLVEVQPITPYVPKHWEGEKSGPDLRGRDGVPGSRLPGSRLSFTELGESLPGSGGSSPGARGPARDLASRLGETPQAQFSSVSDLRQEAKRKLQASISAKVGNSAKLPGWMGGTHRGDEPGTSAPQSAASQNRPSSGGSRSGTFERDPQQDPPHNPPLTTRNPSFDQLMSSTALPPRYSHIPPSLEATPTDRGFGTPKLGTFSSTVLASARLLAESRNPPTSEAPFTTPHIENNPFGSPIPGSRPFHRHDATPPTLTRSVPSYQSARPSYDSAEPPTTSSAVLPAQDTVSPDWLSSKPGAQSPFAPKPETSAAQNASTFTHAERPSSGGAAAPSFSETESSSGYQGFARLLRPGSRDAPASVGARGGSSHQAGVSHQGGYSHRDENGSPGSRRVSENGLGADRRTGIGRKQEFGQGKDVRWHENAIVGAEDDSRPPSEPQSVATTPHAQPFSLQLVQRALEDSLAPLQRAFHQDIHNLHLELLRQFHIQQGETQALVASILERQAALEEEVKALRKENQQLKHFF